MIFSSKLLNFVRWCEFVFLNKSEQRKFRRNCVVISVIPNFRSISGFQPWKGNCRIIKWFAAALIKEFEHVLREFMWLLNVTFSLKLSETFGIRSRRRHPFVNQIHERSLGRDHGRYCDQQRSPIQKISIPAKRYDVSPPPTGRLNV